MYLYLVRHAEAARVGGDIVHDADRVLTPKGEEEAGLIGRALARLDAQIDFILTSPLARAVQTGGIIGAEGGSRASVRTTANLAPGFSRKSFLAELASLGSNARVIAVGHQPDLGELLSSLIADSGRAVVAFPPGAAAKVFVPPPLTTDEATLHWLLTPDTVRCVFPQP